MRFIRSLILMLTILLVSQAKAQFDSLLKTEQQFPEKYISSVSAKISDVDKKLSRQTLKALKKFRKIELSLKKRIGDKDSIKENDPLAYSTQKLDQLKNEFVNMPDKVITRLTGEYNAYVDTLKSSFKFLQQKSANLIEKSKLVTDKLGVASGKLNVLEGKLLKAEEIKKYFRERRAFLKQKLENMGLAKELTKLEKTSYYYAAYVKEYKDLLKDRKKLEQKAMKLLYSTPLFKKFVSENSMLAGLFRSPGGGSVDINPLLVNSGVQTRASVNAIMQQRIATGGPNAIQAVRQQIREGQAELSKLKDRITNYGSADAEIPSFKPNTQKTKSFLKRLEYGANVQFGKSNRFLPGTSDIGVSIGYKLNTNGSIGIGTSYKLGLGSGWDKIKFSNEGIGLRSYIDWKLKGKFYISGGYEQSYNSSFKNIPELKSYSAWQSSGLLGISKKLQVKGNRGVKFQLLYDFLSYRHTPVTQPFVFRTGVSIK